MNAPTPAAVLAKPVDQVIPLDSITPSTTHIQEMRRARFDKKALEDLATSIRSIGVLQPIVVRPLAAGGKYEIVAGERRFIGAGIAGLKEIRASVCTLSSEQVLEVQLVENLQREGLHELEEAEGYEELMKLKKINAEAIGDMVGKSRSYVFARLKLTALCPEARKAFYAGELDFSKALLIARIAHHDTQRAALLDLTKGALDWGRRSGEPMSYREAHKHVLSNYMLALKSAPFDIKDATLLPKAGDCIKCPKRTGNQADLFGDVKSADVCTDPKCFDDKRQAHFAKDRVKHEAGGYKVIYGADAKKILPDWEDRTDGGRMSGGYVPLAHKDYSGGRYRTAAEILGPDFKPTLLQHPGTGEMIKVATQQQVAAASNKKQPGSSSARRSSAPARPAGPPQPDVDEMLTKRLAQLIHKNAPKAFGKDWLLKLISELVGKLNTRGDSLEAVALAWGWPEDAFDRGRGGAPALATKLGERDLVLLMFHLVFAVGPYTRAEVLKFFGINEQKTRELIIEERRLAKVKARAEAKAAKEAKAAATAAKNLKPFKGNVDFMRPMQPLPALAAIVGSAPLVRTEVTKKIWGYIKRNGLQNKKNRRMINADAKLKPIFGGKKQVSMFEMTKFLNKHLALGPKRAKKGGKK
jgi:ParB/RepB/Spo0J family partition protein